MYLGGLAAHFYQPEKILYSIHLQTITKPSILYPKNSDSAHFEIQATFVYLLGDCYGQWPDHVAEKQPLVDQPKFVVPLH